MNDSDTCSRYAPVIFVVLFYVGLFVFVGVDNIERFFVGEKTATQIFFEEMNRNTKAEDVCIEDRCYTQMSSTFAVSPSSSNAGKAGDMWITEIKTGKKTTYDLISRNGESLVSNLRYTTEEIRVEMQPWTCLRDDCTKILTFHILTSMGDTEMSESDVDAVMKRNGTMRDYEFLF